MSDLKLPAFHNLPSKTINVMLPGEIASELEQYRKSYQQAYGAEVSESDLIREMVRRFMETDRAFQWAKGKQILKNPVTLNEFGTFASTFTLPVALVSNMRASFDLTIAAAAVLLIGVTAILIFILERTVGFDKLMGQGLFRS